MDTLKIRHLTTDTRSPLIECTRSDGSSFLTSPSLRTMQMNARERQVQQLNAADALDDLGPWLPYAGHVPGHCARWLDTYGWVIVQPGIGPGQPNTMAALPDLPAAVDHPVFVANPSDESSPFVIGGARSYRSRLYIDPMSLSGEGIFFHTKDYATYRDGGSWVLRDATLVMECTEAGQRPHFMWRDESSVYAHFNVQVVAVVEWLDDPSRSATSEGRPVVLSQREPIVRFTASGRLQRLRLTTMHGHTEAVLPVYVDTDANELTENERSFLRLS